MKIEINDKDYEFLKDFQNELNTQDTYCTRQPVYFKVMRKSRCDDKEIVDDRYRIFLTERAAREYIRNSHHDPEKVYPYADSAWANKELDRLLEVIRTIKFVNDEEDNSNRD